MNFRKINNITGWAVGIIACLVYTLTREAAGSFWDCGEFVSCAYKMEIPHPPGSPLFSMLGRFFIILFSGGNPNHAASAVNLMSALASGFTILFLFWTITYFVRRMYVNAGENLTPQQIFTVMAAGVVGSFIYTFSDSFWYSAVEGEVYALSSFFTALLFWAMLKWYHADELAQTATEKKRADRWIVFIFFMLGLAITVHLLNLLTIPAIVMLYYFRRYNYNRAGGILALLLSFAITGLVLWVFIYLIPRWSAAFDRIFVNDFKFPFFSGFTVFFILLAILCWVGLRWAERKGKAMLRLCIWCFVFMMVGYSTYVTTLVRSSANPAIDMSEVDNPMSLASYFGREQYGSSPLVYGPHFNAQYKEDPDNPGHVALKKGRMKYEKQGNKYVPIGRDNEPEYQSEDMMLFPRVWDKSNDQGHADFYSEWLGLKQTDPKTGQTVGYDSPTYGQNINWFFTYQMGLMYWRYFMWNFAGKQNDVQGLGNVRDGNWITGISFIDNQLLGDQSKMPDSSKTDNAHNRLYLLPFLLGILGCVFQFFTSKRDWLINFLLFFMTGIAIGIYLNMPGNQPRERDYAFVGSFYAFAIWAGLAVPAFVRLVREKANKTLFNNVLVWGSAITFLIALMSEAWHTKEAFMGAIMIAIVYALFTAIITYAVRALSSNSGNKNAINIAVAIICMIAPVIMAQQEWNDHDRSKKYLPGDMAKAYLESCAPNAILFTFGDNDTYPLWYAQEVEGVRPDIRIINNSLLGIDWYINQLRYKVNQSDPIDVIWTPEQIEGDNRAYMTYQPDPKISQETYYNLYDFMKNVLGKNVLDPETGRDVGPETFPARRFSVPVNADEVRKNGTANATDSILPAMNFEIPTQGNRATLMRNDFAILNIIASNNWKRPIYFTSPYEVDHSLGLGDYLRRDGLTYRLVPVKLHGSIENWVVRTYELNYANNIEFMEQNLLNKFVYNSKRGVYFDEENRRHALTMRTAYAELAGDLADHGKKEEALKVLRKSQMIDPQDLPYAMISRGNDHNVNNLVYLEACYKAGDTVLAQKVKQAIKKDIEQQQRYYQYLAEEHEDLYAGLDEEAQRNQNLIQLMALIDQKYNPAAPKTTNVQVLPNGNKQAADTNRKDSNKKP